MSKRTKITGCPDCLYIDNSDHKGVNGYFCSKLNRYVSFPIGKRSLFDEACPLDELPEAKPILTDAEKVLEKIKDICKKYPQCRGCPFIRPSTKVFCELSHSVPDSWDTAFIAGVIEGEI